MRPAEFYKRYFTVRKCVACGAFLPYDERDAVLCSKCRLRWSVEKTRDCKSCLQSAVDCICQPKELAAVGSLCLLKLSFYEKTRIGISPQIGLIYRLKKKPNLRAEVYIAHDLAFLIEHELSVLGIKDREKELLVTFVPRGRISRRKYGTDQSERVAAALGDALEIPCASIFFRTRFFASEQKKLNKRERFKSIKKQLAIFDGAPIRDKYIILYDDIVTTGATLSAAARLLYRSGAKGVISVCMAQRQ